jgi:lysophospholipase L1-like esterase
VLILNGARYRGGEKGLHVMKLLLGHAKCLAAVFSALILITGCESRAMTPGATAVAPPKDLWVAVVGDSYTGGSEAGGVGEKGWPALVTNELRARGLQLTMHVNAEGASGYVERGINGGVFADQLTDIQPYTNVVVFVGSRNDDTTPPDVVAAAARDAYTKAKAIAPTAKLLVIGPFWPTMEALPETQALRDAVREQATAAGGVFVDPAAEHWLDDPALIGPDGIHPTDAGHAYLADRIAPLIKSELVQP